MPIIKSAKKRVKVAEKASVRNAKTKRTMREAVKAFTAALSGGKPSEIEKAERAAISAIDQASKKAVIHKNKAARKKSQMAAAAKTAGVKLKPKVKSPKPKAKAAPKKTAPKRPPSKTSTKK